MRTRPVVLALPLALALAAPAHAADNRVIGAGVTVRGLDVSGKTVDQAAQYVGGYLGGYLSRDVVVQIGGRTERLKTKDVALKFDPLLTAKRALHAGEARPAGDTTAVDVAPALTHSSRSVAAWARAVRKRVTRRAVDASVRITVRHIFRRHAKRGLSIDPKALAATLDTTLNDSRAPRKFRQPTVPVSPKVTYGELAKRYGTILTIDRNHFRLRLFKGLKIRKTYGIAVGMAGLDTPSGMYAIQNKQVNPAWHVPNSAWAGSLAGQTIPGGAPNNPLKARWMGVANGVGIHGTAEDWSIGSRASHGCIRMHVSDVIDLFRRVPVGAPVLIK
jgi:lipoprotein-anchoring transpeptidase ErfK/SrfK